MHGWHMAEAAYLYRVHDVDLHYRDANGGDVEALRAIDCAIARGEFISFIGSSGMRQRVSLCRALINDPQVLLLDEPFGALDAFTREELWLIVQELHRRTRGTMILITHQLHEAVFLSDRVMVLSSRPGHIVHEAIVALPKPRSRDVAYSAEF